MANHLNHLSLISPVVLQLFPKLLAQVAGFSLPLRVHKANHIFSQGGKKKKAASGTIEKLREDSNIKNLPFTH